MKILSAEFIKSAVEPRQFPADKKYQIAFAGRSNVGKSSLINSLLHRRNLVKTSAAPGKTQTINFFLINKDFYFVDLPGYGYAKAPRSVLDAWAPMIEGYLKDTPVLKAVVVLLDGRRRPDERDIRMIEWLRYYRIPAIYTITKADKLSSNEIPKAIRQICAVLDIPGQPILTSSKNGRGIKELWAEVIKHLSPRA